MKRPSGCSIRTGFLPVLGLCVFAALSPAILFAQELPDSVEGVLSETPADEPSLDAEASPVVPSNSEGDSEYADATDVEETSLSRSFRALSLGMAYEALMDALSADDLFNFRGERDVSLLPHRDQTLIEARGSSFVRRAWFQLQSGTLFIMAYSLSPDHLDHYSVFTRLVERYGEPKNLNPRLAVWEDGETRISLERPLTVKFLDLATLNGLLDDSAVREADVTRLRRDFLDEF